MRLKLVLSFFFLTSLFTSVVLAAPEEVTLPLAYPGAEAREKIPYQNIWNDLAGKEVKKKSFLK